MLKPTTSSEDQSAPYLSAVRQALGSLSKRTQYSRHAHPFEWVEGDKTTIDLPIDSDAPVTDNISRYLMKQMEFVETFLVADRVLKQIQEIKKEERLRVSSRVPDLTKRVEIILKTVGRSIDEDSERGQLLYFPYPHYQPRATVPFVDFAGFLAVLLTDFLKWRGKQRDEPIDRAAKAEIETCMRFLIDPETIIETDEQIGAAWGFIAKKHCDKIDKRPVIRSQRALPTAWAVTAISAYSTLPGHNEALKEEAFELLPKVLEWLKTLRQEEGLFFSSKSVRQVDLIGHNYVTETLLTLVECGVTEAHDLAVEAIKRFDEYLDGDGMEEAKDEVDVTINYRIDINDQPYTQYPDRTTWAGLLSTLSNAAGTLELIKHADVVELSGKVKSKCKIMAEHILNERRDEQGLWPRGKMQFHWVLNAVEALLRYSRYGTLESFSTSSYSVTQAINYVLNDPDFVRDFRNRILNAIKRSSELEDQSDLSDETSVEEA